MPKVALVDIQVPEGSTLYKQAFRMANGRIRFAGDGGEWEVGLKDYDKNALEVGSLTKRSDGTIHSQSRLLKLAH